MDPIHQLEAEVEGQAVRRCIDGQDRSIPPHCTPYRRSYLDLHRSEERVDEWSDGRALGQDQKEAQEKQENNDRGQPPFLARVQELPEEPEVG